jgi:sporulation protein YlmC with PRC-barrel domain
MTRITATIAAAALLGAALPALAQTTQAPANPPAAQRPAPMPPATVPAPGAAAPRAGVPAPAAAADARRASRIIGANVVNDENRAVGEVEELMVSPAGGAVMAVLSVGGFLGIGERYVAVPLSDLRWNTERERWMLPGATVDGLKALPAYSFPERG